MNDAMLKLKDTDGLLKGGIGVKDCTELLNQNLQRRDTWKNK